MPSLPDTDRDVALTTRHSTAGVKPETVLRQYEAEKPPATPTVPENVSINLSFVDPKDYPLFEKFFEFAREVTNAIEKVTFKTLTDSPENWGLMEDYQAATSLTLSRLNPPETHRPRKYYYVWGMRLASSTLPVDLED